MPWTGDSFFNGIEQRVATGVRRAGQYLAVAMRDRININCPAFHEAGDLSNLPGRHPGAAAATAKQHSPVGGPPYLETGNLHDSVRSEMDDESGDSPTATVGTDVEYGKYLEFGTSKMGARPWILSTLYQESDELIQQVIAPADIGGGGANVASAAVEAA